MGSPRRKRTLRRFCIVSWQAGGLIAWFWGGHLGWGPSEQAVFFVREEDAARERLQIRNVSSPGGLGATAVAEVGRFNKKHGKNIVPVRELVR